MFCPNCGNADQKGVYCSACGSALPVGESPLAETDASRNSVAADKEPSAPDGIDEAEQSPSEYDHATSREESTTRDQSPRGTYTGAPAADFGNFAKSVGKGLLGCLGILIIGIVVIVAWWSMQPKNVGYDDVLTPSNAKTFAEHNANWNNDDSDNVTYVQRAMQHLGDKAYGRKFGDLMDWEKAYEQDQEDEKQASTSPTASPLASTAEGAAITLTQDTVCWTSQVSFNKAKLDENDDAKLLEDMKNTFAFIVSKGSQVRILEIKDDGSFGYVAHVRTVSGHLWLFRDPNRDFDYMSGGARYDCWGTPQQFQ